MLRVIIFERERENSSSGGLLEIVGQVNGVLDKLLMDGVGVGQEVGSG